MEVNRSGKCKGPGDAKDRVGDRRGALCTGFTIVYLQRKVVCLVCFVCHVEISQTMVPIAALLVSLESP